MIFFYAMAMLPILIGLFLFAKKHEVVWWEWLAGSAIALLMAALFHWIAIQAQCRDHEIFSGRVISATHHPWWKDEVHHSETTTDSKGNTHTRHWVTHTEHPEHWTCEADFGSYSSTVEHEIDQTFFQQIAIKFCSGKLRTIQPGKPDFYKGDKNDYVADNKTGYVYPVTRRMTFQNRVKASPSLYSYAPVSKDAKVFPYPRCNNPFASDRLIGTAKKTIPLRDFDVMCSLLGPKKKVNLIMIGFGDVGSEIAHVQEAAWIGGKKNDLVLCYGGPDPKRPSWAWTFGWSDAEIVKRNLDTILLQQPVDASIIPVIENEVYRNYTIKNWEDFNYLQVDPPRWSYWVYVIVMIGVQIGFWFWARMNQFGKYGTNPIKVNQYNWAGSNSHMRSGFGGFRSGGRRLFR